MLKDIVWLIKITIIPFLIIMTMFICWHLFLICLKIIIIGFIFIRTLIIISIILALIFVCRFNFFYNVVKTLYHIINFKNILKFKIILISIYKFLILHINYLISLYVFTSSVNSIFNFCIFYIFSWFFNNFYFFYLILSII